jgi:D-alanine transfer protein
MIDDKGFGHPEDQSGPPIVTPHLGPALTAGLLALAALAGGVVYARQVERTYVHTFAPQILEQKNVGSALAQEAFRQPDLLPLYGSSELQIPDVYHACALFRKYPTGFTTFTVGKPGTLCVNMLQEVAGVGADVRGRKVAISVTPSWFCEGVRLNQEAYAGNFSRLHANELAFSTDLSLAVKRGAAARMLEYPAPLQADALLCFALETLKNDSALARPLYYAALPLGKLQTLVLRLQDHWETVACIQEQPGLATDVPHAPSSLAWPTLLATAERRYRPVSNNNPFGFQNQRWLRRWQAEADRNKKSRSDEAFLQDLGHTQQWTDLSLLLHGLQDLGMQPLILSMPISGPYYDHWGVSASARAAYYQKLRETAAAYNVPVLDFADHENDRAFLLEHGHLSPKGWLYYDMALDGFYHDRLAKIASAHTVQAPAANLPPGDRSARSGEDRRPGLPPSKTPSRGGGDKRPAYRGFHQRADGEFIAGWAWDAALPNTPIRVDIYDGERLLATVPAEVFRADLRENGIGNGKHAFRYPTPPELKDGQAHSIRVKIAGTDIDLIDTPKALTYPP